VKISAPKWLHARVSELARVATRTNADECIALVRLADGMTSPPLPIPAVDRVEGRASLTIDALRVEDVARRWRQFVAPEIEDAALLRALIARGAAVAKARPEVDREVAAREASVRRSEVLKSLGITPAKFAREVRRVEADMRARDAEPRLDRGVAIGPSILRFVDALVLVNGTSRGVECESLIVAASKTPVGPPLREDRYSDETIRNSKSTTLRMSANGWSIVDERAKRYGESVSESVRALILGGAVALKLEHVERDEARGLALLRERGPMTAQAFARALWGDVGRHRGTPSVLFRLAKLGLATRAKRDGQVFWAAT
jgi:hypothetical protein